MDYINPLFEKRLRRIVRRHRRMENGVVHRVTSDGLIVARPRIYNPRFPLRGLLLLVGAGLLFKGYLFAHLGEVTYLDRTAQLAEGSLVEKAGAWVMQADIVTVAIANVMTQIGL